MESIRAGLKNAGVPESRVFFEMFTKAVGTKAVGSTSDRSSTPAHDQAGKAEIVFTQSNKTLIWQDHTNSILECAEANDLNPPYSCRQGICGTCQCKLLEGEVEYQENPTAAIEAGSVLICISKPKTPKVVLEL
jgi:uncharacterized protein